MVVKPATALDCPGGPWYLERVPRIFCASPRRATSAGATMTLLSVVRRAGSSLPLSLALAVCLVPSPARAQAVKGTLLGTVTDTTGAGVPGATVTVTEVQTGISRSAATNASGNYTFSNLKDGVYRVEAELPGFRKTVRENVKVDVNTTVRVDLALQVGSLAEAVTVVQEAPPLQTDRADTGRIIESKQTTEMPLSFNRTFPGLLVTVPGATRPRRPTSPFSNSQFGAALGGPIIHNKLFFFADYQGTRDNLGQVNLHNIPPTDYRRGDFSRSPTKIYDPATGNPDGTGRTPFPGNIIPANRISPIAQRLLAFLPAPNLAAALGQNNYQFLGVREKSTEASDVKLTYQASGQDSLSYRFSFQRPVVFDPGTYGIYGGPSNDGFAGTGTNKTFSTALNWTHTFGTTAILDTRAGFIYYHNIAIAQGAGLDPSTEAGIPGP